jgi:DNA polymerase-3 subunit alpha
MGKKIPEKMRAERERFKAGAVEKGYAVEDAEKIFDLIEPFAGYAFNKAHAVCYGTIAYQTAYLKANYPAEYMTAVLRLAPSHPSGTAERVAAAVSECAKLGIPILPPDINRSNAQFDVEVLEDGQTGIRFGLSTIKNVGESPVRAICDARDAQPSRRFESLEDVCNAVDYSQTNKRVMESLIKSGAFDELGDRASLLANLDQALSAAQAYQKALQRGQMGLFGSAVEAPPGAVIDVHKGPSVPRKQLLAWEKEHLGTYLSDHPLNDVMRNVRERRESFQPISDIDTDMVGQSVRLLGIISGIRKMTTRTNRTMAVIQLEDLSGGVEVVFFPEAYDRSSANLVEDSVIVVRGKVDPRNDSFQVLGDEVSVYEIVEPEEEPERQHVCVTLQAASDSAGNLNHLERLVRLFRDLFAGDDLLYLRLEGPTGWRVFRSSFRIDWCPELEAAIAEVLGPGQCSAVSNRSVVTF